jgi:hypothetical protein
VKVGSLVPGDKWLRMDSLIGLNFGQHLYVLVPLSVMGSNKFDRVANRQMMIPVEK